MLDDAGVLDGVEVLDDAGGLEVLDDVAVLVDDGADDDVDVVAAGSVVEPHAVTSTSARRPAPTCQLRLRCRPPISTPVAFVPAIFAGAPAGPGSGGCRRDCVAGRDAPAGTLCRWLDRSLEPGCCAPKIPSCSSVRRSTCPTCRSTTRCTSRSSAPRWPTRRIVGIDTSGAVDMPGVVAVLTAAELGVAPHHGMVKVHDDFARPPLATDRVRFVGDAIVAVFAETPAQARDAADLVIVDYDPLPALVHPERRARRRRAAAVRGARLNIANSPPTPTTRTSSPTPTSSCAAATSTSASRWHRWSRTPRRRCRAEDGRLTMYGSTQMPHLLQGLLAAALKMPKSDVHVITPHVGGGFGGKAGLYPEQSIVAKAAMSWVGRCCGRRRAARTWARSPTAGHRSSTSSSAASATARSPGCACACSATPARTPGSVRSCPRALGGCRTAPTASRRSSSTSTVAVTNTTPTGAYRGAGRPGGHRAARAGRGPRRARARHRPDRAAPQEPAHRRRVPLQDPHRDHLRHRRLRRSRSTRRLRLVGLRPAARRAGGARAGPTTRCCSASACPPTWRSPPAAGRGVRRSRDPRRRLGHRARPARRRTARATRRPFAMIVADRTGIPVERIRLVQSDTDLVRSGGGTVAPARCSSAARRCSKATEAMVDKARHLAAHLLEANVDDIVVDTEAAASAWPGCRPARSTGRHWRAPRPTRPRGSSTAPTARSGSPRQLDFDQGEATFPFGAHIAVVEVDTRDRQGRAAAPRRRRRLRQRGQPAAGRGPAARRRRRRDRPGALRAGRVTTRTATRSPATRRLHDPVARPSARSSRRTARRRRRRSTRSGRRASARRARSAAPLPCRTR